MLGYGGGYVLSVSASGTSATDSEQHVADVVLGVNRVLDRMQGETYFGPAAIECYRYRIGHYSYLVSYAPIACPVPDTPASEQAVATRWAAGLTTAESLFDDQVPHGAVPASLAQAETLLAPVQRRVSATRPASSPTPAGSLTSTDFGTGTNVAAGHEYGTAIAALAIPLTNGTCAYVSFGYITENDGTRDMVSRGWAAPRHATCDGQAALAASIPFSVDPTAGG